MDEAGYSRRGLATELQRRRPRKDVESWRGTVRDYLKDAALPGPTIAALLAEVLEKPADYFVRPQRRTTENDRLREELAEARAELGRLQERLEEDRTAEKSGAGRG